MAAYLALSEHYIQQLGIHLQLIKEKDIQKLFLAIGGSPP